MLGASRRRAKAVVITPCNFFTLSANTCVYLGEINSTGTWGDYNGTEDQKSWGRVLIQLDANYRPDANSPAISTQDWATITNKDSLLTNITDGIRYGMTASTNSQAAGTRLGSTLTGGTGSTITTAGASYYAGITIMQASGSSTNNNAIWVYDKPSKNGYKRRWPNGSQPFNFKYKRWIVGSSSGNTPLINLNKIIIRWNGLTEVTYRPYLINGKKYFCNPNNIIGDKLPVILYTEIPAS